MSDDSVYLGIFLRVFDDLVEITPGYSPREAKLDRDTVLQRYRSEGLAFVTKTLPSLGKHLESALEDGTFKPLPAFKREKGRTTPVFLRSLFKEVFDDEGSLLDSPCAKSIGHIRQICYFMYKFDADYPADLVDKVIQNFVDVDLSLDSYEAEDREQRLLLTIASAWLFRVFRDFDPADIRPRPGPGASASGTHKSQRYEPLTHYRCVHEKYPYYRYFYMGSEHLLDRVNAYRSMPRKEHAVSVLRTVPKDSRGPRIICMEEQELMFLQQGLGDALRTHVESHPLTRGQVNFFDQTINQRLALSASESREFATLDMKDASDRISRKLVGRLFAHLPELLSCLLALSTPQVKLPNGLVVSTKKFAPMGSSLCFPIMSVVHHALAVAAIHLATARPTSEIAKDIYVYGDDIVVRSSCANYLFDAFPKFDLMFNRGKSFVKGSFRESCGVDAFRGVNVTPQRLKRRFFDGRDPQDISAVMDMYAALKERGLHGMASMLRTVTDTRFGEFPEVGSSSPFLGWRTGDVVYTPGMCVIHTSKKLERQEVVRASLPFVWEADWQSYSVSARVMETEPDCSMSGGWEQLMRSQLVAHRRSARIDERYSRKIIRYRREPACALHGSGSTWLPKAYVRL